MTTMPVQTSLLNTIAKDLDISPTDFLMAQKRYQALGDWLVEGTYESGTATAVYLQGSFRLGTVVKPFRDGQDREFDIDQVCELQERAITADPSGLKHDIGDQLKSHGRYESMLDPEGRRCWTLQYATQPGRPGFHVDILPALRASVPSDTKVDITNWDGHTYSWSPSNPNGYYRWFKSKNAISEEQLREYRTEIFESTRETFESVEQIPKQLVRTSLQRALQLVKRHRDVHFDGRSHRPSSISITTILAKVYLGGPIQAALQNFVQYVCSRHEEIMSGNPVPLDQILDFQAGEWSISNPADTDENFGDRWNSDPRIASAFFLWVYQLARDLYGFSESGWSGDLHLGVKAYGDQETFPARQVRSLAAYPRSISIGYTDDLLRLIHLGIEGKVEWEQIEAMANERRSGMGADYSDVDWVNHYQIYRHQGKPLPIGGDDRVRQILARHQGEANYVLCCNLLLGRATRKMVGDCIKSNGNLSPVMGWPIIRLAPDEFFVPGPDGHTG